MVVSSPNSTVSLTQSELVEQARALAAERSQDDMDLGTKVDVLEAPMMELLDIQTMTPPVGRVASLATGSPRCERSLADGRNSALGELDHSPASQSSTRSTAAYVETFRV